MKKILYLDFDVICFDKCFLRLKATIKSSIIKKMSQGNKMMKIVCFFTLFLILFPYNSKAEIKTYTHTVKQPFSGSQSPDDARIAAIAKAKREVLEMAGTYLETMAVVKDHQVESDDIFALAAGVLKAKIVSQNNYASDEGFGVVIKTKVDVDTSILDERVKALLEDKVLLDKYKDNQNREKDLLSKVKELERENKKLKNLPPTQRDKKKQTIKEEIKITSQRLTASDLFLRALSFWQSYEYTDPNRALEYLNKAIRLDQDVPSYYLYRGLALYGIGEYDKAVSDFNKIIEQNPFYAEAYLNRGMTWATKGKYDSAFFDFNKAIELTPTKPKSYYNRAYLWVLRGEHEKALADYDKAIDLNPNFTFAIFNRAITHSKNGDYDRAILDYSKAIELNPDMAKAFLYRGDAYYYKDDYDRAIHDYSKAIELNPDMAIAFLYRGYAWGRINKLEKACPDYKKACQLGDCEGLKWANEKGYCK